MKKTLEFNPSYRDNFMKLPNQQLTCWSVPRCPKDVNVFARSSLLITPSLFRCTMNIKNKPNFQMKKQLHWFSPVSVNGGKHFITFIFFPFIPHYPGILSLSWDIIDILGYYHMCTIKLILEDLAIARRNSSISTVSDLERGMLRYGGLLAP